MKKQTEKLSSKHALPPGSVVYIGDREGETSVFTYGEYDENEFTEKQSRTIGEVFPFPQTRRVRWLNVGGIRNTDIIEKIGGECRFHPLMIEDIVNTHQRPKYEDYEDSLFIVMKGLSWCGETYEITEDQVSFILKNGYLISFQETEENLFSSIMDRLRMKKGMIRSHGADYLLYVLIDAVVDSYFSLLETLDEEIEALEETLLENPTPETLKKIYMLKSTVISLRKTLWPLREIIGRLEKMESPLIGRHTRVFFRDVYDHTLHIIDTVETFRDLIGGMLDIYLSSVSNKTNEVMKVLTIIATIFIPITFLVGVYGMNFKFIPELQWRWGYFGVWGIIIIIIAGLIAFFKKKKWF
ncbi:MAG: magnesium/cobalt transporter CorA [Spirochaetales bacterium]|nr:magnesium/cobalt transporter CorA [Spirochaetales bacterium]